MAQLALPHIWLPFDNGSGSTYQDQGNTGAEFGVINPVPSTAWTDEAGWFSMVDAASAIWSHNANVLSIMDYLNGTADGVGGGCLCMMFDVYSPAGTSSVLLNAGSSTTSKKGWRFTRNNERLRHDLINATTPVTAEISGSEGFEDASTTTY